MNCIELASLFEYPWEKPVVQDAELSAQLRPLVTFIGRESLEDVQDLFTRTFDLSPTIPPYVGFHLHGESYRRGTLMAQLRTFYTRYEVDEAGELPDHVAPIVKLLGVAQEDAALDELIREELKPGMDKLLTASAEEEKDNPYRALLLAAAKAMEARLA